MTTGQGPATGVTPAGAADRERGALLLDELFPAGTLRRLDWGCGEHPEPGWLAADLKDGPAIHLSGDIRDGLALPDGSLDYIVSIHALPMISYPDLVPVLQELRRVLKPGGVLRLCLPDLDKNVAAYQRGDRDFFLVPDEDEDTLSGKLIVQLMWYGWSVTPFTSEFIVSLLHRAGFGPVTPCGFQQSPSGLPGICDLDNRPAESLFVEAVR
jgi:SAM-dependent methyltransferase